MSGVEEAVLKAVANPRRREILRLIWSEELSSGDIASRFDVTWPAISQNLRLLENAGLIKSRSRGTTRLYRADRRRLAPLKSILQAMWETDIDRLAELAELEEREKQP